MQAYSMAETGRSSQLHLVKRPSALSLGATSDGNAVLDQLLVQLADLVADRVAAQLVAPARQRVDEWLDTRRAAEYLGIGRDSVRRLAAERAIPTEQAGVGCKLYFRRSDPDQWRCSGSSPVIAMERRAMADSEGTARRVRVERGIYRRATGVLEVGFKDETGRQRWPTVDGGILAARKVRDEHQRMDAGGLRRIRQVRVSSSFLVAAATPGRLRRRSRVGRSSAGERRMT